jgi:Domain of unknown function (DUF5666)
MRMARWGVMVAVVIACAACNRHESMTSTYGSGVVTGQVVMAAQGTSASPAGVRVSVVGTGMSTLLGPDGRFTFAGVPEDAELRFMRDDGIDARMSVPGASFVVELAGNSAKSGKKRAVPSLPGVEIEGLIKTASATSLVIVQSKGGGTEVTVNLDASTVIRHGNKTIDVADLKQGDRVHVKVTGTGEVKTATLVLVQNQGGKGEDDNPDGTTATANGTVKSVGTDSLVVTTVPKGDVTVQVDESTIIKRHGDRITLADIKEGDRVNSLGTVVDDHTIKARKIEAEGKPKDKDHGGKGKGGDD